MFTAFPIRIRAVVVALVLSGSVTCASAASGTKPVLDYLTAGATAHDLAVGWSHDDHAQDPDSLDRPIGYEVQVRVGQDWIKKAEVSWDFRAARITGLDPGAVYTVRVCALYGSEDGIECSDTLQQATWASGVGELLALRPPQILAVLPRRDALTLYWEPRSSHGFFQTRIGRDLREGGAAQQEHGVNDRGRTFEGLAPGTTYKVMVQACAKEFWTGSSCTDWVATTGTTLSPLPAPSLRLLTRHAPKAVSIGWEPAAYAQKMDLFLDAKLVATLNEVEVISSQAELPLPEANTPYTVRACWTRHDEYQCAELPDVRGAAVLPSAPQFPVRLDLGRVRVSEYVAEALRAGVPYVGWTNGEIPGFELVIEREYTELSIRNTPQLIQKRWLEVAKQPGKGRPRYMAIPPAAQLPLALRATPTSQVRICATVPDLPQGAGRACSPPVDAP